VVRSSTNILVRIQAVWKYNCGSYSVEWVDIRLTPPPSEPAVTALCHCIDCQKWSGGAYTSNVVVPHTAFKVASSNKPKEYDAMGNSGKINKHFFCGTCGSALYTELEVMPEMTCVKAGTLDGGAADFGKVGVEFYTKDRVSFAPACEGAKQEPVFG
jgi:hypothetical protein